MIEPRRLIPAINRTVTPAADDAELVGTAALPAHPELEYESQSLSSTSNILFTIAEENSDDCMEASSVDHRKNHVKLLASVLALVLSGTSRSVFFKLQTLHLYNYPSFTNLFSNCMIVLICFAYLILSSPFHCNSTDRPVSHPTVSKPPLVVMGILDGIVGSMQAFASVYLSGSLVVLLPQAAIPFSIVLSSALLQQHFYKKQYWGAAIVLVGIVVTVAPFLWGEHSNEFYCEAINEATSCHLCQLEMTEYECLSHSGGLLPSFAKATAETLNILGNESTACQRLPRHDAKCHDELLIVFWSFVMIASAFPSTLSTIYKEIAFRDTTDMNPISLLAWTSLFQLMFSVVFTVPSALLASPSIPPHHLPSNLWDGFQCYLGVDSVTTGCHPDDLCSTQASLFFNLCLLSNVVYTLSILRVLQHGSTTVLFLALTAVVPLAHLSFALPVVPTTAAMMHASDMLGLLIIVIGLVLYHLPAGVTEITGFACSGSPLCGPDIVAFETDWPHNDNSASAVIRGRMIYHTWRNLRFVAAGLNTV